MGENELKEQDLILLQRLKKGKESILSELHKVIIGQDDPIEEFLIALFSRGHCLIEGVPGLAKTLMIRTLAKILDLRFNRIQFTPDLMPADITGTDVIEEDPLSKKREFRFFHGPIFTNILLADEINRTSPKTQAALLQAMQEYQVTTGGQTYSLELPFFVLATQNPIEQEGTYPLPEAQLDRFFFQVKIGYPSREEEVLIARQTTSDYQIETEEVLSADEIRELQGFVRRVPVSDYVANYAINLVRASRPDYEKSPRFIKDWVSWGAGVRASQNLILGGKARAVLDGRYAVSTDDIKALSYPVLRHRIILNFNAEAEGVGVEDVITKLLEEVKPTSTP